MKILFWILAAALLITLIILAFQTSAQPNMPISIAPVKPTGNTPVPSTQQAIKFNP